MAGRRGASRIKLFLRMLCLAAASSQMNFTVARFVMHAARQPAGLEAHTCSCTHTQSHTHRRPGKQVKKPLPHSTNSTHGIASRTPSRRVCIDWRDFSLVAVSKALLSFQRVSRLMHRYSDILLKLLFRAGLPFLARRICDARSAHCRHTSTYFN